MTNFEIKNVKSEAWRRNDYRPIAVVNKPIETILSKRVVEWSFQIEEGLGKTKSAYFLYGEQNQFCLTGYLDSGFPLTEIVVLHTNQEQMLNELSVILEFLELDRSEVDFIYTY